MGVLGSGLRKKYALHFARAGIAWLISEMFPEAYFSETIGSEEIAEQGDFAHNVPAGTLWEACGLAFQA